MTTDARTSPWAKPADAPPGELPPGRCPHCRNAMDNVHALLKEARKSSGQQHVMTICNDCGGWILIGRDGALSRAPEELIATARAESPGLYAMVEEVIALRIKSRDAKREAPSCG